MGICVVKATQDKGDDRYLLWHTVVDNFTFVGTHREMFHYLTDPWGTRQIEPDWVKRMLDRADERGSSSEMRRWVWDYEQGQIANLHDTDEWRILPRANLGQVWDRMHTWAEGDAEVPEPSILDLTKPAPEEE